MNLHDMLKERAAEGRPVRVGLIGAGKFGSMFLAQARFTPALHIVGVADLDVERARSGMRKLGWPSSQIDASDADQAVSSGKTYLTDDGLSLIEASGLDVIIEATGDPGAGVRHALTAIEHGRHLVMVNVEADVLVGPILAERAKKAGLVYSLAYGDQPALICEMVDWARTAGFPVVCAGKGTRYLPAMHRSTPKTVWQHFGITGDEAAEAGMNPKMFNSFVDGTKSGIEMAAVANACGLKVPSKGLGFPACGVDDLAYVLRPASMGGQLEHDGTVEVVTDLERDGRPVYRDLRWGVYITFKAPSDYARACFSQYGLNIDPTGDIASIYRPIHMIGLELGISVASAALRGEPTGCPKSFEADVIATAKKDMPAGHVLDGEGGACVWGKLMPAGMSVAGDYLPIGLAHNVELTRPVAAGACLTMADVALDPGDPLIALRRTMTGSAP